MGDDTQPSPPVPRSIELEAELAAMTAHMSSSSLRRPWLDAIAVAWRHGWLAGREARASADV